ncbi:glyoxal oxidase-related protein [Actinidia rufa]|uniref:Glyoxal oxidase-related protein n=1 Tax=Actinidia rufa TaxID=165716 RepID=A0A7J0GHW4_9ERIC|nr:glyoxal oxidase-related protein [Actinidia rufa]
MTPNPIFLFFLHLSLFTLVPSAAAAGGQWVLLNQNIGIVAMHMQLLRNDRVVIFDRTDFGLSNISLPNGQCRNDPNDTTLQTDCSAHSVEYDVASNSIRPLTVLTDVWCSSGSVAPDGRLIQTGGFNDGDHVVRIYRPCSDCDWDEIKSGLTQRRWDVLIINGASAGTAGWEVGRDPVLKPIIYQPDNLIGSRFEVQNPSDVPRMYHSTAVLLRDGRVLVGGSLNMRPKIISPASSAKLGYQQWIAVQFTVASTVNGNLVSVTMVAPSFNTHSFSMNQRLLVLGGGNVTTLGKSTYEIGVVTPGSGKLAPPGYYMLFVVHQEIPSEGIWVQIQ